MDMGYLRWFRIYLEQTNNKDKARIPQFLSTKGKRQKVCLYQKQVRREE